MDYINELKNIAKANGGIIETKVAALHGISKAMLYKLCKAEKIHRIVKGQYVLPDDMQDELLSISNRSDKIIFSLLAFSQRIFIDARFCLMAQPYQTMQLHATNCTV